MAGPGLLKFLDLPPEEVPGSAPRAAPKAQATPQMSAAGFLPMLSTAGLATDSDSDDGLVIQREGQYQEVLAMACEPPPEAFPGLPTHIILRVLRIGGLAGKIESKGIPGREDLGFFLEEKNPLERSTVRGLMSC